MLRGLYRTFVFGHFWLGSGAAMQAWSTWWVLDLGPVPKRALLFVALATVSAYGFMRGMRIMDAVSGADHLDWLRRHRSGLWTLTGLSAVLSSWCLWEAEPDLFLLLAALVPAVLLYVTPWTQGRGGLRSVPLFKVVLIAAVWAAMVVLVPILFVTSTVPAGGVLLVAERFFFLMAITLPFDIRDLPTEPLKWTFPGYFGICTTKLFALIALALSFSILFAVSHEGFLWWSFLPGYMLVAWLIAKARAGAQGPYYSFWLDGTLVFVPLISVLLTTAFGNN
ncbi:MAG: hypothetical protein KDB88_00650 [Flavobacteriales bacterium]|nr:hypothetical protein [Flavobacteriales bacterium]